MIIRWYCLRIIISEEQDWLNRHIRGKYSFEEVTPGLKQTRLFGPGAL